MEITIAWWRTSALSRISLAREMALPKAGATSPTRIMMVPMQMTSSMRANPPPQARCERRPAQTLRPMPMLMPRKIQDASLAVNPTFWVPSEIGSNPEGRRA